MTYGEVWWVDFPTVGRRPGLIITRTVAVPVLDNLVLATVSTSIRGVPTEVLLDRHDGMPRPSAVSLDNLHTVPKRLLGRRIATLSDKRMDQVCDALRYATSC